jgi:ketosteroid isomerase-like protein
MQRSLLPVSLFLSGLLIVAAGLLGGSQPTNAQDSALEQGINATIQAAVAAYNRGDLPALSRLFTDDAFQQEFSETKSEAASDPEFFGDQVSVGAIRNILETETGASATVDFASGLGISSEDLTFVLQGGIWIATSSQPGSGEVAEGTALVDLMLKEFAFIYDADAVASGDFAFKVTNNGTQEHEVLLVQLPGEISTPDLVDAIANSDENSPPPFEDFGFLGVFEPGTTRTAALAHPLDEGYYALVCFLPDTDGVPHAFKGMVSEFTVGSPAATGPISPPNTGDGGLLAGSATANLWVMALGVVVLVTGAVSGLRAMRN